MVHQISGHPASIRLFACSECVSQIVCYIECYLYKLEETRVATVDVHIQARWNEPSPNRLGDDIATESEYEHPVTTT